MNFLASDFETYSFTFLEMDLLFVVKFLDYLRFSYETILGR